MSAPATKAFSPAPVTTIARTPSSCLRSRTTRRSSSRVWELRAFSTRGRLIVTNATGPSRSTSRFSKGMGLRIYNLRLGIGNGLIHRLSLDARPDRVHRVQEHDGHRGANRVGRQIVQLGCPRRDEQLVKLVAHAV